MENENTAIARRYHEHTKHSPVSVQSSRHRMDWDNPPSPFKEYVGLESLPLPIELPSTGVPAWKALRSSALNFGQAADPADRVIPSLEQIAHILYYAAGVTRKLTLPDQEIFFRAAACAGALYPIEVYLAASELPGIPAGVYHFSPLTFSLNRLRTGDFLPILAAATGGESFTATAPVALIFTAITWRSSWKYQARAYRYHYWDTGTILAQCLAAAAAHALPTRILAGFVDQEVDRLLGLDGQVEKSICLLPLGHDPNRRTEPPPPLSVIHPQVRAISQTYVPEPEIDAVHEASSISSGAATAAWRAAGPQPGARPPRDVELQKAATLSQENWPEATIEEVILRRGSSRRFRQESISLAELSSIMTHGIRRMAADWLEEHRDLLNHPFLSVHAVDGLRPGTYRYWPEETVFEPLRSGNFRGDSANLCLGQHLGGDASVTIYFLSDLESIFDRYGNRGYRLAQLEAGILGGRIYLLAYALGKGATGLTFFDDLVIQFFSPAALDLDPIFVVSCGVPAPMGMTRGRMIRIKPGQGRGQIKS